MASLLLCAILCFHFVIGVEKSPEVQLTQGLLRGIVEKTIHGTEFNSFYGIPYAKPPVGKHRFKMPVPAGPWTGVWNATVRPNSCLQYSYQIHQTPSTVVGSEDCLYVNVFTPKNFKPGDGRMFDVLLNIHGGGFQFLSGSDYGPGFIMNRDIVYVAFNYRLGVLGFLSLEDDVLPGNLGLWDQNLAMKWVKKNIAAFGGDPTKITLSGMSAGGASVHYHLLSQHSRGLFQKAIINSGSVLNPWAHSHNSRQKTLRLAAEVGCPTDNSAKIVDCLRERSAEIVSKFTQLFRVYNYLPISPIGPIIEKPSQYAFIDKQPYDIIKNNGAYDVPTLWSYNSDEGLFPGGEIISDESDVIDNNWDYYMTNIMELNFTAEAKQQLQVVRQIREHYLGGKSVRKNPAGFTKLIGDRYFYNGINEAVKLHAAHSSSPVHLYRFSYVGKSRLSDMYRIENAYKGGACHGDDTHYVLRASYVSVDGNPEANQMIKTTTDVWMDFIQGKLSWEPVKNGLPDLTLLDIVSPDPAKNKAITMKDTPGQELWKSFNLAENSNHHKVPRHNEL